jgi:hypothetical protein
MGTVVNEQPILDLPLNVRRTGALALLRRELHRLKNFPYTERKKGGSGDDGSIFAGRKRFQTFSGRNMSELSPGTLF